MRNQALQPKLFLGGHLASLCVFKCEKKVYKSVYTFQGGGVHGCTAGCTTATVSNGARYKTNGKFINQKIGTRKKWQHSNQQCAESVRTASIRSIS